MRPILPVLVGWHDAMVETAFDRAELEATGSLERRTRIPRWLRAVNGLEIALGRALGKLPPAAGRDSGRPPLGYRMFRPARIVVPAALGTVAAIHAAWALGWRWPGGTDRALAERVVGAGAELPAEPLVWAAAAGLGGAGGGAAAARAAPSRAGSPGCYLERRLSPRGPRGALHPGRPDRRSRLRLCAARPDALLPLCIALGFGAAIVARGPRQAGSGGTAVSEPRGQVAYS